MGRLKKYQTTEEKVEAKRLRARMYYWNNKQDQDEKQRKRDSIKRESKNMFPV
jgi:hypothetical protein